MSFEEIEGGGTEMRIEPVSVEDHEALLAANKLCAKLEKVESIAGLKFMPKLQ
jgi:hypothetical protein